MIENDGVILMPNIFITHHYSRNKGDQSILIGTIDAIKKVIPTSEIVVSTYDSAFTVDRDVKWVDWIFDFKDVVGKGLPKKIIWIIQNLIWIIQISIWLIIEKYLKINRFLLMSEEKRRRLQPFKDADIVISCGGGYITDNYGGPLPLFFVLYEIFLAIALRKDVMIYSQSIGPFNKKISKLATKYVLNKVKLITCRESISKEVLLNIGVNKPTVFITADPAFYLIPANKKRINEILDNEGVIKGKKQNLIGISLRNWWYPSFSDPDVRHNNYLKIISRVSDYLIKYLNAEIIFIPMDIKDTSTDDRVLALEIIHMMDCQKDVKLIRGEYTPEELKGVIGEMDLFIGTRFHSIIFATAMQVPVVSIMYEHKAMGIMKMLNLERYVCDINELDQNELILKINEAWSNKDEIRTLLKANLSILKELDLINANFVNQLIDFSKIQNQKDFLGKLSQEQKAILKRFN